MLILRLSQPSLAGVGTGADLGKNVQAVAKPNLNDENAETVDKPHARLNVLAKPWPNIADSVEMKSTCKTIPVLEPF